MYHHSNTFLGEIKYWEHLDEMYGIYDAVRNNSYTNTESVNFWFPEFYHGYCEEESGNNSTDSKARDSEDDEDDSWGDFGDFDAKEKTFEAEDCTDGEDLVRVQGSRNLGTII